jgi:hypothetical protein
MQTYQMVIKEKCISQKSTENQNNVKGVVMNCF